MFPKVTIRLPNASALFPKLNLAKALLTIGYTGIAAVFISALTYLVQLSADRVASTPQLTITFLTLNLFAWWLGGYARMDRASERFGKTLIMLGDLLILLNLYIICFLYVPLLEGQVYRSLTAALAAGICYHSYQYRRL